MSVSAATLPRSKPDTMRIEGEREEHLASYNLFMDLQVTLEEHPLLDPACFSVGLGGPLSDHPSPDWPLALLSLEADAPLERSEEVRVATRDLLRHGGYKPTGRGKPASEYLVRAVGEGK